ncbi:hypothetical protein H2203_005741 [Taxawa tesnikishii (nom. ined.)]|nr:hypothetical protein H2203_005741 [Dothideales sp. JES 119]
MADIGGAPDPDLTHSKCRGGTLPALAVGQPYAPCIVSLCDLTPIRLADLRLETHHRGRSLTVKRVSPVVTLTARSWAIVQDEEGETERLEMCLHKLRHGEEVLESCKAFVIKEPYFTLTDQGEGTLRIDHPSDLIMCRDQTSRPPTPGMLAPLSVAREDSRIANGTLTLANETKNQAEDAAAAEKMARKCKEEGNAALKAHDLTVAHARYTEGLKAALQPIMSATDPDLALDISRNRAHVNLLLHQYDEAKTDAVASLTRGSDQRFKGVDGKAYFRAGCAAYNLGEYRQAKGFFEQQQKLTPSDKDASANLRRLAIRLREQETGAYDFSKLRAALSRARSRVDAADFIGNTEIKESPGRGRGLFATRDIPAGEIVMCEKAFCVVWGHEREAQTAMTYDVRDDRIRASPLGLTTSLVQKLLSNPSQIGRVMDLWGDYRGDGENVYRTEEGPVVDTFRVHDIVSRNAFGPGSQYGETASTGLWIWAAYINHSCIPNTGREYIGDMMIVRATRSITAGEEILSSYDSSADYDERTLSLTTTWGFECNCALCAAEKEDDAAVRKKRVELTKEANAFVEREDWAGAKRVVITKARRLIKAIDETYDEERYRGVPRAATERIREWLAKASARR